MIDKSEEFIYGPLLIRKFSDCFDIIGFYDSIPEKLILPNSKDIGLNPRKICGFKNCDTICEVIIPEGYEEIDGLAFAFSSIKKITIPASICYINPSALSCCSRLEYIHVDENNENYDSRESCNAIIRTCLDKMIVGCNNSIIVPGIRSISASVFLNFIKKDTIYIPGTVTDIIGATETIWESLYFPKPLTIFIENPKCLTKFIKIIDNTKNNIILYLPEKYKDIVFCKYINIHYYSGSEISYSYSGEGIIGPKVNKDGENSYKGTVHIYKKYYDVVTERTIKTAGIGDFAFYNCRELEKVIIPKEIKDNISPPAFINYNGEIEYV